MTATSDQDLERWRALVERGLKGAPFDTLIAETLEGLTIQPLYTERDRPAEEGIPWPPRSPRLLGPATIFPERIALQRDRGATFTWLHTADDADALRRQVSDLDGMTTILASRSPERVASMGSRWVRPIADPWAQWISSAAPRGDEIELGSLDVIASAVAEGRPSLGIATWLWRETDGADVIDELALSLASLIASLRALEDRNVSLEAAVEGATIGVSVGPEFFLEIAKLRALRRLVDRVLVSCGIAARPFVASVTSVRATSLVDPAVNILRNTLAASAALIGGADGVAVHRHEGGQGESGLATRVARNLPLVLSLESHLGDPSDPARGSYYVEHLTSELVGRAWELFREIERIGGLVKAHALVHARLVDAAKKREAAVRTRRRPMVGLSRFPAPGAPRPSPTDAAPFEMLRYRAERRVARVITVGACPPARVDFARETLAISGLSDDVHAFVDDAAASLGDASIVILAAPDAALAVEVPAVARALKAAGARAIGVAGKPGSHEQVLREAGVDAFAFVGADVVSFADVLLDRAGASAS